MTHIELNPKLKQIVPDIIAGSTNIEIAEKHHRSLSTIKLRVSHMMELLDVKNRIQLAVALDRMGHLLIILSLVGSLGNPDMESDSFIRSTARSTRISRRLEDDLLRGTSNGNC